MLRKSTAESLGRLTEVCVSSGHFPRTAWSWRRPTPGRTTKDQHSKLWFQVQTDSVSTPARSTIIDPLTPQLTFPFAASEAAIIPTFLPNLDPNRTI